MDLKRQRLRAVMLYVVQREDVDHFSPADSIDPEYGRLLREAHSLGVEILVYQCKMGLDAINLGRPLASSLCPS
jgi:sugar fermentation stimulation protein A